MAKPEINLKLVKVGEFDTKIPAEMPQTVSTTNYLNFYLVREKLVFQTEINQKPIGRIMIMYHGDSCGKTFEPYTAMISELFLSRKLRLYWTYDGVVLKLRINFIQCVRSR